MKLVLERRLELLSLTASRLAGRVFTSIPSLIKLVQERRLAQKEPLRGTPKPYSIPPCGTCIYFNSLSDKTGTGEETRSEGAPSGNS